MQALVLEPDAIRRVDDPHLIAEAHAEGHLVWVDLGERTEAAEKLLAEGFGLHHLTIEDVWESRSIPKIDKFDEYLFVLVHGVRTGSSAKDLELVEVDIVVGRDFVITHHTDSRAVVAAWTEAVASRRLLERGPAFVLHAVLDELVDHYFPVLNELDDALDGLEEEVLTMASHPGSEKLMSRALEFKRTVQLLRRNGLHQRELLLRLGRDDCAHIPRDSLPFFRDVYDHFARVIDLTDDYREVLTAALEAFFSMQSNRMNEIMKTLTLISTVMLPLTFVAGVYGMNFDNMPELRWRYGYLFALTLMAAIAIGILLWFRKRRWL